MKRRKTIKPERILFIEVPRSMGREEFKQLFIKIVKEAMKNEKKEN